MGPILKIQHAEKSDFINDSNKYYIQFRYIFEKDYRLLKIRNLR